MLVATASLELGIDIGTVDLVVQISSPRAIAVALQRVGRSGHWRGAVPKGRFFVSTRDDLLECAALVRAIRQGDLDRLIIPDAPLDILAQQIVAACAAESSSARVERALARGRRKPYQKLRIRKRNFGQRYGTSQCKPHDLCRSRDAGGAPAPHKPSGEDDGGWDEDELFALVTRAYPYRNLSRETLRLDSGNAFRRDCLAPRALWRLHPSRPSEPEAAATAGQPAGCDHQRRRHSGDRAFTVVAEPDGIVVGTLDEDFAVESNAGDIMLLGNTSWRIRRVEGKSGRVLVEDAHGAPPSVPFWRGEAPARTQELSAHVAGLRKEISDRLHGISPIGVSQSQPAVAETVAWLKEECGLDDSGAEQAIEYILQGRAVLGDVPTQDTIIAERFFDEGGGMQLIIHAPFGGRINKAWGLALRKRFCRSFNFELQAAATDNGLNIALAEQHSFPLADVFHFLNAETVQPVLEQAALASPIFGTRWRWDANRALALLRFQGGKKVPPQIQRMRSDDLLASVFPDVAACQENIVGDIQIPDHPLVKEVMKDVLTEAMDIDGLKTLLSGIQEGRIRCLAVDTPVPSQFSHEILNANPYAYLDDAPLEERRARAVEMRRILPESVLEEVGKLDPAAIAQVREEAWPDVRDADELHDVLHTLIAFPACVEAGDSPAQTEAAPLSLFGMPGQSNCARPDSRGRLSPRESQRARVAGIFRKTAGARACRPGRARRSGLLGRGRAGGDIFICCSRALEFDRPVAEIKATLPSADDALLALVTGWMSHLGPATASQLGELLGLPASEIEKALLRMEASGALLRGQFTDAASRASRPRPHQAELELEWCERRLLARIHRLDCRDLAQAD